MRNKHGHTLLELLVALSISSLIITSLSGTLGGLQSAILRSKSVINSAVDGGFILELVQRDLRNMVHPSLTSALQWEGKEGRADLFLSKIQGYQGERRVTLVGYQYNRKKGEPKLFRKDRSMSWNRPLFGIGEEKGLMVPMTLEMTQDWIEDKGELISSRLLDFVFYYHYQQSKAVPCSITTRPDPGLGELKYVTVFMMLLDPTPVPLEALLERTDHLLEGDDPRDRGGALGMPLPWVQRAEKIRESFSEKEKKNIKTQEAHRTIAVSVQ